MNNFNFATTKLDIDVEWNVDTVGPLEVVIAEAIESALVEKIKSEGYYEEFPVYYNTDYSDDDNQNKLVKAIKTGKAEYAEYLKENPDFKDGDKQFILSNIENEFDNLRVFAHDEAMQQFGGDYGGDLSTALISALEEIEDELGVDKEAILDSICQFEEFGEEALEEYFTNKVEETMQDMNTAGIEGILGSFGKIPMAYTTIHDDNLHDSMVECRNNTGDAPVVVPDHKLVAYFKMINLPPASFYKAIKDVHNEDVLDDTFDDYEDWQKLLDTPLSELGINPKRKSAISPEMAVLLIDNMPQYYGLPTVVINLTPQQLMEMDKDKHFLITEGGQVALHDYMSGAGHMESAEGPIVLPQDLEQWHPADGPESLYGYGFNETYGCSLSAFDADIKTVQVQSSPQMELDGKGF